jgi:SAM-dependent methyltransferase
MTRPQAVDWNERAIVWGHPSYVWDAGQERRLSMIRRVVPLDGQRILDIGCGIGAYVDAFRRFTPWVYGVDLDAEKLARAKTPGRLAVAPGEDLPFRSNVFDLVLLHEVIEHVRDDRLTIAEAVRVARPGGAVVIFAPNRLYPFETHGIYLGKRYVYRLVPFINYLPRPVRDRFCPHVRVYDHRDMYRLFKGLPVTVTTHRCIYPGFDKLSGRSPLAAWLLRRTLYALERTPAHIFGLSHFIVAVKHGHTNGATPTNGAHTYRLSSGHRCPTPRPQDLAEGQSPSALPADGRS